MWCGYTNHMNRLKVACHCSHRSFTAVQGARQTDRQTDRQAGHRMMRAMEGNLPLPSQGGILPTQRMVQNPAFPLCIIYFKQSKESLSSPVFCYRQCTRKWTRSKIPSALRFNASITYRYFVLVYCIYGTTDSKSNLCVWSKTSGRYTT
jgi:hypothetical protein